MTSERPAGDAAASRRIATVAIHAAFATAVVLAVGALIARLVQGDISISHRSGTIEEFLDDGAFIAARAVAGLLFAAAGWYISTRRPGIVLGPVALAAGLGNAAGAAGAQWVILSEVAGHDLPGAAVGLWLTWAFAVEPLALVALFVLFPSGHLPRGIPGGIGAGALYVAALGALVAAVNPPRIDPAGPLARLAPLPGIAGLPSVDGAVFFAPAIVVATIVLIVRWRRAGGEERRALRPVAVLGLVGLLIPATLVLAAGPFISQIHTLVLLAVVVGTVLRNRVYGIDVVVSRTLLYVVLSTVVAAVYAFLLGIAALAGATSGDSWPVVAAVVAAFSLAPARNRAQLLVNRFLYGERDEPYAVVSRLGAELESSGSADRLLPGLVETIATTLRVPYVAIELDVHDMGMRRTIEYGSPRPAAERYPMVHRGAMIGALLIGSRPGEGAISAAERQLLCNIARQAAVAASNVVLTTQLVQSRQRVVAAAEAERARLRRDLHDGIGPVLTAAASRVDAARNVVVEDATRADSFLVDVRADLTSALEDLRRLVYALRPPALDELGLAGAVRAHVERSPIPIILHMADGLPSVPSTVELAAYRIITEAIANVTRHADAGLCTVSIGVDDDDEHLSIQVLDDGVDRAAWAPGVGLGSMRERVEELGGSWEAGPSGAGGRVSVTLPLRPQLATR